MSGTILYNRPPPSYILATIRVWMMSSFLFRSITREWRVNLGENADDRCVMVSNSILQFFRVNFRCWRVVFAEEIKFVTREVIGNLWWCPYLHSLLYRLVFRHRCCKSLCYHISFDDQAGLSGERTGSQLFSRPFFFVRSRLSISFAQESVILTALRKTVCYAAITWGQRYRDADSIVVRTIRAARNASPIRGERSIAGIGLRFPCPTKASTTRLLQQGRHRYGAANSRIGTGDGLRTVNTCENMGFSIYLQQTWLL